MQHIKRIVFALILGVAFLSTSGRSLFSITQASAEGHSEAKGGQGGSGASCG